MVKQANNMPEEWKLAFNKNNVKISKMVERPSDKQLAYLDVEIIEYDKMKNINMTVTKIENNSENGKPLIFYASEFKLIDPSISPEFIFGNMIVIGDERIPCNKSNDVLKSTVEWLFESGRIQEKDLPIFVLNGGRYLLNKIPYHSNKRKFDGVPYEVINKMPNQDVYLNTNFSAIDCRKQSRYLMKKFASDVRFEIIASSKNKENGYKKLEQILGQD